jgi:hypothetical protein
VSADLIRVRFSGQAIRELSKARSISSSLAEVLERKGLELLNQAGELGLKAAQSTVPIDGGQLREDIELKTASSFLDTAIVYVAPRDHVNKRGQSFYRKGGESNSKTRVIGSPALADLLNLGKHPSGADMQRSRPSLSHSGFNSVTGKTAGWEDDARSQFMVALRRMLNSARS